jgi:hypothetical protein
LDKDVHDCQKYDNCAPCRHTEPTLRR